MTGLGFFVDPGLVITGIPLFFLGMVGLILSLSSSRIGKRETKQFEFGELVKLLILSAAILFVALVAAGFFVD